jgi:hypothetical protein
MMKVRIWEYAYLSLLVPIKCVGRFIKCVGTYQKKMCREIDLLYITQKAKRKE